MADEEHDNDQEDSSAQEDCKQNNYTIATMESPGVERFGIFFFVVSPKISRILASSYENSSK